jgi:hypothetical protein
MEFECGACGAKKNHEPTQGTPEAMPSGWLMHEIGAHRLLLCSACGHPGNFIGGLSSALSERLRARGVAIGDPGDKPKGQRGKDWGEVKLIHRGKRHNGTYVVEEGLLTLTYVAENGARPTRSAHANGSGPHDALARLLLSELVIPESRRQNG